MTMTDDVAAPPILAAEVCMRASVTYRQLDYWSRRGFIPNTAKGSGVPRHFTEADVGYITQFSRLVHAGLSHDKADEILKLGLLKDGMVRLTDHVVLVFDEVDRGHDIPNS
jgi:DNA-binding transcriptional MerR regulator